MLALPLVQDQIDVSPKPIIEIGHETDLVELWLEIGLEEQFDHSRLEHITGPGVIMLFVADRVWTAGEVIIGL